MDWRRATGFASCAASCLGVLACSGLAAPPKQQPARLDVPTAPGETTFVAEWPVLEGFALDPVRDRALKAKLQLNVSKAIRRQCALVEPRFAFDSVEVREDDDADVQRLSKCLTTGPLKDRHVRLIGRADIRGEPEYNLALGLRRAERIKQLLVQNGVAAPRIVATTRGATATVGWAHGYTYADDRRVDVLLVD